MRCGERWLPYCLCVVLLVSIACSAFFGEDSSAQQRQLNVVETPVAQPAVNPDQRAKPTAKPDDAAEAAVPAPPPVGLVLVGDEKDQRLTFIDASSSQITKTIHIDVPPQKIAIGPDGRTGWLVSSLPHGSDVYFVDLIRREQLGSIRLGGEPGAMAFSSDGSRAFVALQDDNSVVFLRTSDRRKLGVVHLGRQTDGVKIRRHPQSLAVIPGRAGDVLYVAGYGSGVVWVLDAGSGQLLAEVEVGGGPAVLLPDRVNGRVYVLVVTLNQLVTIDSATQQVTDRLTLPGRVVSAAIGPAGEIYVTAADAGEIWIVEPAKRALTGRVRVGAGPADVTFSADGGRAYVTNRGDGTLTVLDVPTQRVVSTFHVGQSPAMVAFAAPVRATATPVPTPSGTTPTPTPTVVPTPTPLPQGAQRPERLPPGTAKEVFVPHAEFPVAMAFAPDGRLFYAEFRTGKIRVVENGVLLAEPLYDFAVSGQPETGLIGLTLDPNFAKNHYLYVFYTQSVDEPQDGGNNGPNQVVRLTEINGKGSDLTPIVANLPSGQVHNGGSLRFGPDGRLYITLGETGDMSNAQNLHSPAGKILRVNPDGTIPSDNPFIGQSNQYALIWAYGFRNPFDLDFHPVGGTLIAGESGPGDNDELNLVVKGGNYGWPPSGFQDKPNVIDPIAAIDPVNPPVGLAFYQGNQIPEWKNDLFYCNFHQGELRRVHLAPGSFDRIVFEEVVTPGCLLNVATGSDGALYYSDLTTIYRIRRKDAPALPTVAAGNAAKATPTTTLPAGTRPQDRDVNVDLTEWKIGLSRSVVPTGRIRFLVENLGITVHALRIHGNGIDVATENFGSGSRSLEVVLPPGRYELSCPVGRHADLGMVTTLTVIGQ